MRRDYRPRDGSDEISDRVGMGPLGSFSAPLHVPTLPLDATAGFSPVSVVFASDRNGWFWPILRWAKFRSELSLPDDVGSRELRSVHTKAFLSANRYSEVHTNELHRPHTETGEVSGKCRAALLLRLHRHPGASDVDRPRSNVDRSISDRCLKHRRHVFNRAEARKKASESQKADGDKGKASVLIGHVDVSFSRRGGFQGWRLPPRSDALRLGGCGASSPPRRGDETSLDW